MNWVIPKESLKVLASNCVYLHSVFAFDATLGVETVKNGHFAAARKSYNLGNYAQALAELDMLGTEYRSQPQILELR